MNSYICGLPKDIKVVLDVDITFTYFSYFTFKTVSWYNDSDL